MRVPGYTPNYHNTAANRAVRWSTVNNPVSNFSILFQLSNMEIQAAKMRKQSLKSSARIFSNIVPTTTPPVRLSSITLLNKIYYDVLNKPMSPEYASLFIHRPDTACGPDEQAAPSRPTFPDTLPTSPQSLRGWGSFGGMLTSQFISETESFRAKLVTGKRTPRSSLLGWNSVAGNLARLMHAMFGTPKKPDQDDK